ncbi:MAG: (Fe-S)-binding protein, partial [Anaerolineae bacterium]|nr:(Fe-S)-binding protein [Anaerolineae bacterium]
MLSSTERIAFIIMVLVFGGITAYGFARIFNIVRSSRSAPKREKVVPSMIKALVDVGLQKPIFQARPLLSTFHAFIFFGFSYYLLVNVTDVLEGFVNGFELLYGGEYLAKAIPAAAGLVESGIFNVYNLAADILSIGVLVGMLAFIIRRVSGTDKRLRFNQGVVLHPKVEKGSVFKDSYIVGGFIMVHVGSRFMGQVLRLA